MGVNVKFQELCPDNYTGKTYSEHAKLASLFEGKVVAIDGSMFICQVLNPLYVPNGILSPAFGVWQHDSVLMLFLL